MFLKLKKRKIRIPSDTGIHASSHVWHHLNTSVVSDIAACQLIRPRKSQSNTLTCKNEIISMSISLYSATSWPWISVNHTLYRMLPSTEDIDLTVYDNKNIFFANFWKFNSCAEAIYMATPMAKCHYSLLSHVYRVAQKLIQYQMIQNRIKACQWDQIYSSN